MARVNEKMDIGLVGLAVMGQNLVLNLVDHGYRVAVHNRTTATTRRFLAERAAGLPVMGADTLEDLVELLAPPRRILLMVKAGAPVDSFIKRLLPLLSPGDVLADLGNSFYLDTARRLSRTETHGIHYLGVGVSGGEEGARRGPSIMAGGGLQAWDLLRDPLTAISAKLPDGTPCCDRLGPEGAGHFVKMVHNGIEYGMMQALGEGFELLAAKEDFQLDLAAVSENWRYGSVIRSWLLDLGASALSDDPDLSSLSSYVEDSGEGRWTVDASVELAVPAPVITAALQYRFRSRQEDPIAGRMLAALRQQFGGHAVKRQAN